MSQVTLGGVAIDDEATLDINLTLTTVSNRGVLEYSDGVTEVQRVGAAWNKTVVRATFAGWIPPAIAALDPDAAHAFIFPDLASPGDERTITGKFLQVPTRRDNITAPGGGAVGWDFLLRES